MPIAYKYRPGRGPIDANKHQEIFERDLKLLSEDKIYVPTVAQLNDPSEAIVDDSQLHLVFELFSPLARESMLRVEDAYANFRKHIQTAGIYSLSKTSVSELMWAYYANGHNGYAIVFDTDVLFKSLNGGTRFADIHAFDVKYVNSIPQIDVSILSKKNSVETIQHFIGCKSMSWKHEQEYRLVFDKGGEIKHIDYRAIKGFIFGYLMPEDDIEYIMGLFKGRHLSYYRTRLNPEKYQFYTEKVDDIFKDAPNYHPNGVNYDFDALIEDAKFYDDVILDYKEEARQALEIVACEPFVEGIYLLCMYENENNPGAYQITIGADYSNPSVIQPKKVFRFELKDKRVVRIE